MWMRLSSGVVCDLCSTDPAKLFTDSVAAEFTPAPAGAPAHLVAGYAYDGTTWTPPGIAIIPPWVPPPPSLDSVKAAQTAIIEAACQAQIVGGYTSSALGAVHTYPSGLTDQANMTASVLSSLMPNNPSGWTTQFLCEDASGTWAFVAHTAAQIQQAGEDGKAAILAARVRNATLAAQIAAATTVTDVQAITW